MWTFTNATNFLLAATKVPATDTTNTALLQQLWNDSRRTVAAINGGDWPWLEIEEEVQTVASIEYVQIPNHIRKVISVRQQNGSDPGDVIYRPRMIFDSDRWDMILAQLLGDSDVPLFCYQREQKLYIQPVPSSSGDRTIMRGFIKLYDLSIADYTTGSIVTATLDSTAVVGSGTSWNASMIGEWIRVTRTSSANGGDGYWYEIAAVADTTHLTLKKPYQGASIAAGSAAYTIGQITYEPESYQMAPIYRTLWQFLLINDPLHPERWQTYAKLYDGGQEAGLSREVGGLVGQMMEEAGKSMGGPYIPPMPRAGTDRDWPPYWFPWQDATGF